MEDTRDSVRSKSNQRTKDEEMCIRLSVLCVWVSEGSRQLGHNSTTSLGSVRRVLASCDASPAYPASSRSLSSPTNSLQMLLAHTYPTAVPPISIDYMALPTLSFSLLPSPAPPFLLTFLLPIPLHSPPCLPSNYTRRTLYSSSPAILTSLTHPNPTITCILWGHPHHHP